MNTAQKRFHELETFSSSKPFRIFYMFFFLLFKLVSYINFLSFLMLLSPIWLPVLPKLLIVSNCLLNAQIRMSSYSREFKQFTLLLPYSFSMFFSFARWKAQSCLFMKNEKEKLHVNLNLWKEIFVVVKSDSETTQGKFFYFIQLSITFPLPIFYVKDIMPIGMVIPYYEIQSWHPYMSLFDLDPSLSDWKVHKLYY